MSTKICIHLNVPFGFLVQNIILALCSTSTPRVQKREYIRVTWNREIDYVAS